MAVELRGKSIRLRWHEDGRERTITWPYKATPAQIREAERVQGRIRRDLSDGTFTCIEDYLPHLESVSRIEFGAAAQKWLDSSCTASPRVRADYVAVLNGTWIPAFEEHDKPLAQVTPTMIKGMVKRLHDREGLSQKRKNDMLIPLRQVLKAAYQDEITRKNLADFVQSRKAEESVPDPFSKGEAQQIIDHLANTHLGNWWPFMFYTGLRTSEALALEWGDIDFQAETMRIHQVQTNYEYRDSTKTGKDRTVDLNPVALAALKRQKAKTFLAGGRVFVAQDGDNYTGENAQRKQFRRALMKLGLRARPQYNTRHTYATMLIMAGVNHNYVAAQLGHSVQMLYKHYAKWIDGADNKTELAKLNLKEAV